MLNYPRTRRGCLFRPCSRLLRWPYRILSSRARIVVASHGCDFVHRFTGRLGNASFRHHREEPAHQIFSFPLFFLVKFSSQGTTAWSIMVDGGRRLHSERCAHSPGQRHRPKRHHPTFPSIIFPLPLPVPLPLPSPFPPGSVIIDVISISRNGNCRHSEI